LPIRICSIWGNIVKVNVLDVDTEMKRIFAYLKKPYS